MTLVELTCLHGIDHCWWKDCGEEPRGWRELPPAFWSWTKRIRECPGHAEAPLEGTSFTLRIGGPHVVVSR